jgi:two-component system OmpR family response regulator
VDKPVRVLVVEDEPKMAGLLRRGLVEEGYAVDVAADGANGFGAAASRDYDAVVLDVMLPGLSGFEVCRRLRLDGVWVPVLMLTARDAVGDRICGLDGGADDYLTKPFHLEELFARLRALTRRGPVSRPTVLSAGDLRVDPAARRCWRSDTEVELTAKEYALLEMFLHRPGAVLTREVLLEHCWDFAYESRSNVVEVHIRALREKIDRRFGLSSLETVRGVGYRLRADGGRAR